MTSAFVRAARAARRRRRAARAVLLATTAAVFCNPSVAGAASSPPAAAGSWPTYQYNLARTGFNPDETAINASSVGTLAPNWIFRAANTISPQAVAANGLIYWGSWDGLEHATNPKTGQDAWETYIGQETDTNCSPPHLGVASTAAAVTMKVAGQQRELLFVGGGDGSYYALDAQTGAIIWSTNFGSPQQGYFSWSSPAVVGGSVYVGISSVGDCPLVPGAIVKLSAATGAIQASFATTPPGCPGGGIWSSPTVDTATGYVYVTTGTDGGGACGQPEPYAQAFLQLTKNLSLLGAFKVPSSQQVIDGDFGATPNLFAVTINGVVRQLAGAANKNGIYYALDRTNFAAGPVWQTQPIATSGDTIASATWDGNQLYLGGSTTTIGGTSCGASVRAIDPSSGAFTWSTCLSGGNVDGSITSIPGVIFAGAGSILYGLSSSTGAVLFQYQDTSYHWFYSPAMVSNGALYIGNSDGNFYRFTPGGQ